MINATTLYLDADGHVRGPGEDQLPLTYPAETRVENDASGFGIVNTVWSSSSRATFPTVGPGYHDFENEVMAVAVADQGAILTKYVNKFRGQKSGVSAAEVTAHRARLQAFITAYNAAYP